MKKILAVILLSIFCVSAYAGERVTVFAAASATNMVDELLAIYNSKGGNAVGSYAGSGTLAKQIEAGAPAAIFISANREWADYLESKNVTAPDTKKDLLINRLVLVAKADSNITVDLKSKPDLVKILQGGKFAMGAPESVPAGKYAKEAFIKLGLWEKLEKHIAAVDNVRVALAFVSRGEAPMGAVFETDAKADKNVKIVAVFPEGSHEEIVYPIVMVKANATAEGKKVYEFLLSDEATKIYEKHGFKRK